MDGRIASVAEYSLAPKNYTDRRAQERQRQHTSRSRGFSTTHVFVPDNLPSHDHLKCHDDVRSWW